MMRRREHLLETAQAMEQEVDPESLEEIRAAGEVRGRRRSGLPQQAACEVRGQRRSVA